jgi:UDPglucose 6-dehydrogenase
MRISVIGCGYLGAVHAACMAKLGHDVVGIDVDERKITELSKATAPFYEPGLEDLLRDVQGTGRLTFTSDMSAAAGCEAHFICVGTPQKTGENGADLSFVDAATVSL